MRAARASSCWHLCGSQELPTNGGIHHEHQAADVVFEQHLDTFAGEQFDRLENVIRVDVDRESVRFETTRSHAAWKRGETNAGRGVWTFPRSSLEAVWIADTAGGDWIAD